MICWRPREERKAHQVALCVSSSCIPSPPAGERCLGEFKAAPEVFWVQEEPRNMGPWRFVREQLESCSRTVTGWFAT